MTSEQAAMRRDGISAETSESNPATEATTSQAPTIRRRRKSKHRRGRTNIRSPHTTVPKMLAVLHAPALSTGPASVEKLAAETGISERHTLYALADGAALLGLVTRSNKLWSLTESGQRLVATARGSMAEREILRTAMLTNAFIASVVAAPQISSAEIKDLLRAAGFSETSVTRRASPLAVWRRWFIG